MALKPAAVMHVRNLHSSGTLPPGALLWKQVLGNQSNLCATRHTCAPLRPSRESNKFIWLLCGTILFLSCGRLSHYHFIEIIKRKSNVLIIHTNVCSGMHIIGYVRINNKCTRRRASDPRESHCSAERVEWYIFSVYGRIESVSEALCAHAASVPFYCYLTYIVQTSRCSTPVFTVLLVQLVLLLAGRTVNIPWH